MVLDKPAGLSSEEGVPAALRQRWGRPDAYVGVNHRLDTGVSGLMVYARTPGAAAALTKQVDQRFMQPHRSYIISMAHITAFYYDHLVMDSGLEITLSRKKRAALKEQYHHYLSEITRGEYSL